MSNSSPLLIFSEMCAALRSQRVRSLYGISEEDQAWQAKVWSVLTQIESVEDLPRWTASVRLALWGNPMPWEKSQFELDPLVAKEGWYKGRLLLGEAIMQWISDDQWVNNAPFLIGLSSKAEEVWTLPSLAPCLEKASSLAKRFGLRHVRVAAGWSSSQVMSALDEAEAGLMDMALLLDWKDIEIGANRIGLSWGLNHDVDSSAHYDILTTTININEPGSFAHEWAHALDLTLGVSWDPLSSGKMKYASHQADWFIKNRPRWSNPPEMGSIEEAQLSIANRDLLPQSSVAAMQISQDVLAQLPLVLSALAENLPHKEWKEKVTQRLNAYKKWWNLVVSPEPNLEQVRSQWDRWKLGCEVAWSQPEDEAGHRFGARWFRIIRCAEKVAFGAWPRHSAWHSWASAKDVEDDREYWATPHELWARSFHAAISNKAGHSTWCASLTKDPDQFPVGQEGIDILEWWNCWLPVWKDSWVSEQKLLLSKSNESEKFVVPGVVSSPKNAVLEKSMDESLDETEDSIVSWKRPFFRGVHHE